MAELIVVGFKKDMYRASEVLNTLQDMNNSWVVDLHDAVAVYRDYSGKLRVDQSYQMTTGEGAAWGGLFGASSGPYSQPPSPAVRPTRSAGVSGLRAWDDPHDRAAITIGMDLYQRRPVGVTGRDLLNAVIASPSILKRPYGP